VTSEDTNVEAQGGAVEETKPLLRIVTPNTTPEEVAAIVAVFAAMGGGEPAPEPPRSLWASPERGMRTAPGRALAAGRGAWRASGLPR
jgi:hypothetical protein